ncbi:hypothetical protein E2C01_050117 [Portunus trituberculatus]|uniref:Uncharacterized protein n=1 Tax=Portunus trituberculatus TaxID=210409 RepID=A0A5B7GI18_PORTR|nr:hypothetical protein [Portunus trituberculatus]
MIERNTKKTPGNRFGILTTGKEGGLLFPFLCAESRSCSRNTLKAIIPQTSHLASLSRQGRQHCPSLACHLPSLLLGFPPNVTLD